MEQVYDIDRLVEQMGEGRVPENELMRLQRECQQRPADDTTVTIDRSELFNIVHELRNHRHVMTWLGAAVDASHRMWDAYQVEEDEARMLRGQQELFERERRAEVYGRRLK